MIQITKLCCGYGLNPVIRDLSFAAESGEILCILGSNGVGKTTLLKTILGLLPLQNGSVELEGRPLSSLSRIELAKLAGYIPQAHIPSFPYRVFDVVLMGRTAYLGVFSTPTVMDETVAEEALEQMGVLSIKDRLYTEISGGERQLVLIARTLCQQSPLLVMDEPTANLDFGNQARVLEKISALKNKGFTIIMSTHFPSQAFLCADKVLLLTPNNYLLGTPNEIITEQNLRIAYGIDVKIVDCFFEKEKEFKTCVPILHTKKGQSD